jgi:CDP-glycerol glycerophosphotransferase (TagB/SpsB family)
MRDFTFGDVELVSDVGGSLQDIISHSALLVTDYSSISMEFALIRRPVLYFQFDRESFFREQPYSRGYFDYERDGFGEIVLTVEDLCTLVAQYLRDGCLLKEKYHLRSENFFTFFDFANCSRVYETISEYR